MTHDFDQNEIDNNGCIYMDVFGKNYSVAPASYKKRIDELTSSCEEIALWWDKV